MRQPRHSSTIKKGSSQGKNQLHSNADKAHRLPLLHTAENQHGVAAAAPLNKSACDPPSTLLLRPHTTDNTAPLRPETAQHRWQGATQTAAAAGARCQDTAGCCKDIAAAAAAATAAAGPCTCPAQKEGWLLMRLHWSCSWSARQQPSRSDPCSNKTNKTGVRVPP